MLIFKALLNTISYDEQIYEFASNKKAQIYRQIKELKHIKQILLKGTN